MKLGYLGTRRPHTPGSEAAPASLGQLSQQIQELSWDLREHGSTRKWEQQAEFLQRFCEDEIRARDERIEELKFENMELKAANEDLCCVLTEKLHEFTELRDNIHSKVSKAIETKVLRHIDVSSGEVQSNSSILSARLAALQEDLDALTAENATLEAANKEWSSKHSHLVSRVASLESCVLSNEDAAYTRIQDRLQGRQIPFFNRRSKSLMDAIQANCDGLHDLIASAMSGREPDLGLLLSPNTFSTATGGEADEADIVAQLEEIDASLLELKDRVADCFLEKYSKWCVTQ